jgi:hypothetical protein
VTPVGVIVEAIGGWRATAFLGAAIAMAVVAGGWRLKAESLELAASKHAADDAQAAAAAVTRQMWALDNARDIEFAHRVKLGEITGRLARENQDAQKDFDARLAAARAGTARLREDRKCPAAPAAQPEAGTAVAGSDGAPGAYLPGQALDRVLRIGGLEADAVVRQLTAAQDELLACHEAVARWNAAQAAQR